MGRPILKDVLKDGRVHFFVIGVIALVILIWPTTPPFSFPSRSIVTVSEGDGLYLLAEQLRKDEVIRSPFLFRMAAIILGGERDMKAGDYYMSKPQNTFTIAWRIVHGDYGIETVKITIPEGLTVEEISKLFDTRFKFFDHKTFIAQAPEGYLFPDTYFIPVTATASSTIKLFRDNFTRKIAAVTPEIDLSGKTLQEIITMASILEAEVLHQEDREIVSGILWKRLSIDMLLQIDSEPNTYKVLGLPEQPINNPGLVSIEAALHPTTTPYLYFLTGKDGKAHYAKTFDEHKANRIKYLNK